MAQNFENRLSFVEQSHFFLHNHVWRKKSSTSEKRAVFQNGSPGEPFSKKRLETALFFSKKALFKLSKSTIIALLESRFPDEKKV